MAIFTPFLGITEKYHPIRNSYGRMEKIWLEKPNQYPWAFILVFSPFVSWHKYYIASLSFHWECEGKRYGFKKNSIPKRKYQEAMEAQSRQESVIGFQTQRTKSLQIECIWPWTREVASNAQCICKTYYASCVKGNLIYIKLF